MRRTEEGHAADTAPRKLLLRKLVVDVVILVPTVGKDAR